MKFTGKMAADSIFIDTNILIYANSHNSEWKDHAVHKLKHYEQLGYELWISRQVIREYLVVMSKLMLNAGIYDEQKLTKDAELLTEQFHIADETASTTQILLSLIKTYKVIGKSIHDCSIVATMKQYQIVNILTHNVGDFVRYMRDLLSYLLLTRLKTKLLSPPQKPVSPAPPKIYC